MNTAELHFDRPPGQEAASPPETRGLPRDGVRLLVSRGRHHEHARFSDLPRILEPGTVLVVNRSAVLPSSVPATGRWGPFRLNLSTAYGNGLWVAEPRWQATAPGPLPISAGDAVDVAGLPARFIVPYPNVPRLWFVRIDGEVQAAIQRLGESIRYSYLRPPYPPLEAYQTIFADTPGSAEVPSAARPFTLHLVNALIRTGVVVRSVLLHCGVSSLEVEAESIEDHVLYPEPFNVPADTAAAVNHARQNGRPVIAVGTTVVRALESASDAGKLVPRSGFTSKFIRPGIAIDSVDGLLTGLHDPRASHLAMLYALAGPSVIKGAYEIAVRDGYLWHEFGDSHLIIP